MAAQSHFTRRAARALLLYGRSLRRHRRRRPGRPVTKG